MDACVCACVHVFVCTCMRAFMHNVSRKLDPPNHNGNIIFFYCNLVNQCLIVIIS